MAIGILRRAFDRLTLWEPEFSWIFRPVRAWTDQLQNSEIEGPRHLTEQIRKNYRIRKHQEVAASAHLMMAVKMAVIRM